METNKFHKKQKKKQEKGKEDGERREEKKKKERGLEGEQILGGGWGGGKGMAQGGKLSCINFCSFILI